MIKTNNIREEIVELSKLQYHKEYIHGHMGPDAFDCAGLVWYIYNEIFDINIFELGFGISTTTKIMTSTFGKITLFEESLKDKDLSLIKKGDVLFFHRQSLNDTIPRYDNKYPGHCGIYLGNKKFIHAKRNSKKVIINTFNKEYWLNKLVGFKNIVDDERIYEMVKAKMK